MKIRLLPFAVALFAIMILIQSCGTTSSTSAGGDDPLNPAQKTDRIFLGPVAGYNSIQHSTDKLATFAGDAYCPFFEGGTGQGFYFGLSYEHHLGKMEESTSSIIGRVLYSMYPGSMDVAGDSYETLVEDLVAPNGIGFVTSSTKHTIDIDYNVLAFEVMYKQNFIKEIPLGVSAGPTFEIPITKNILQEYHLVQPDNVQFTKVEGRTYKNNNRTVVVYDDEITNALPIRVGLKFGVQYEIIIGQGYYIVPGLWYNFGLTPVKSDEDYRMHIFQTGVDVRIAF